MGWQWGTSGMRQIKPRKVRWPLWVSVGSVIVVPSCPLGLNGPVLVPDNSRDQEHAAWGRPGGVRGRCGTV